MSTGALYRRAREARDWLFEACFPLWAEEGLEGAGFCERLDLQHRQIVRGQARVRVQARQTYVFAAAARLGWQPDRARGLVERGVRMLGENSRRPDGLFGRSVELTGDGGLEDGPGGDADLYDTAFALFALASVHAPALAATVRPIIDETLTAIDRLLADETGGYAEALPRPSLRQQNPHMHLFEACLQLAAGKDAPEHMARGEALQTLCLKHFVDNETGTLGEYFEPGSWAIPEGNAGSLVEPGHHFEWVWLLNRHAQMMNKPPPEIVGKLYEFACETLDEDGRAVQSCRRDGTLVDGSRRTWPQTEALKAHMVMWQAGDAAAGVRAVTSFDILMDEYLTPEGGWIDHYGADGRILSQHMPASTGYHVVLAFADMIGRTET